MSGFVQCRRKQLAELRPYVPGEPMEGISISDEDKLAGSPKEGDMIARNPRNHKDRWLVAKAYYEANFETTAKAITRAHFRILETECCHTILCWVNPRLPNYCPDCGTRCYPAVRSWIAFSDEQAYITHEVQD